MCFDFVDNGQTETFLVIRVIERDIVKVKTSTCKVTVILVSCK
jgi:hypothetical protein